MAGNKQVSVIMSLKNKMSKPLFKISGNVTNVTKEMKNAERQIKRWGKNGIKAMDDIIGKSAKVVGALGGIAIGAAVKTGLDGFVELDQASAKVKSIAGESLALEKIQKDLLKTSNQTGIGVSELAETQYSAISAGIDASDSIAASVQASKLAKAGFTDSNSALKVLAATMNTYGLTGEEAMTGISDKLLTTQNLGVTTVAELSSSLGDLTPIAASSGLGIDEMLSSIASLTKGGMTTSSAVTKMKAVMSSFVKPTKEAQEMAAQLGIDFSTTAIETKGFGGVMEEIKAKTGGNTDQMAKLFGSVEALGAALALTSDEGMEDFQNTLGEMGNATGATEKAFDVMSDTVGFKMDKMKNAVKNAFTSIMQSNSDTIGGFMDNITNWVTDNEALIQEWIDKIGEGVGDIIAFVKGVFDFINKHQDVIIFVVSFIGGLYLAIKALAVYESAMVAAEFAMALFNGTLVVSPLGWLVLAIAAVIAIGVLLWKNWDTVKIKAAELWEKIKTTFEPVGEFFGNLWGGVQDGFKEFINFFTEKIKWVTDKIDWVKGNVGWILGDDLGNNQPTNGNYTVNLGGKFAKGGIATRASIFGEAGPEIAIPLKRDNNSLGLLAKANAIIGKKNNNANGAITKAKTVIDKNNNANGAITKAKTVIDKNNNANGLIAKAKIVIGKKNNNVNGLPDKARAVFSGGNNTSKSIVVHNHFSGVTVGKKEFFDEVGAHISKKVKLAIDNM